MLNAFYKFPDTAGDYGSAETEYCLWKVTMQAEEGNSKQVAWFAFEDDITVNQARIQIAEQTDGEMFHIKKVQCVGFVNVNPDKETVNFDRDEELWFFKLKLAENTNLSKEEIESIYAQSRKAAIDEPGPAERRATGMDDALLHEESRKQQEEAIAADQEAAQGENFNRDGK